MSAPRSVAQCEPLIVEVCKSSARWTRAGTSQRDVPTELPKKCELKVKLWEVQQPHAAITFVHESDRSREISPLPRPGGHTFSCGLRHAETAGAAHLFPAASG
jgi:hypothetical protein